ncbi:hypothetical protein AAZX31_03G044100 [Glycine max]
MALTRYFFLGTLLMSILMSVRESLLKLTWDLTISGASTRALFWSMTSTMTTSLPYFLP